MFPHPPFRLADSIMHPLPLSQMVPGITLSNQVLAFKALSQALLCEEPGLGSSSQCKV